MTLRTQNSVCTAMRGEFSAYLDGAVSGRKMAAIGKHLDACHDCEREFAAWREVQTALADLGHSKIPERLQSQLRLAVAAERERSAHLPALSRWVEMLAPMAYRGAGALAMTLVLVGGMSWLFAAPLTSVEANDEAMAHLNSPHYLYSQVPPQPIYSADAAPIVVDAKVDNKGRVYDFVVVEGQPDKDVRLRIEENLLSSVFKPATVFGEPVSGHVMLTYTGISVRG